MPTRAGSRVHCRNMGTSDKQSRGMGPGATNLVTAAAYANLGAMPVVVITGQNLSKGASKVNFRLSMSLIYWYR